MNKIKATIAYLKNLFKIEEIPITEGKSSFTDEQLKQLSTKVGEDVAKEIIAAIDQAAGEIAEGEAEDQELTLVKDELAQFIKDNDLTDEDVNKAKTSEDGKKKNPSLAKMIDKLTKKVKDQDEKIQKLMNEDELDTPVAKGTFSPNKEMRHSSTHFLGTGRDLDAFDGRNWNQRAAGLSTKPTDWAADGAAIQKLKSDIEDNWTEVDSKIKSLHRDYLNLPSYFKLRSNVSDRVADGNIVTAEITQGRKLPWLPKNKQLIQPEEGKVFPVNIDIEFKGVRLQEIEASWLAGYNKEGTSPYKMGFVDFLLMEIDKQARVEDRKVAINGVYTKTPDDATTPGLAINRGDGLMIQLYRAIHIDKKMKVPNMAPPNFQNIVSHIKELIEKNLDEAIRNNAGIVINLHPDKLRDYCDRYKQLHGTEINYKDGEDKKVRNYDNVRFEVVYDLQNPDFMFLTFDNNVELLENLPNEKSIYRMDTLKRDVFIFGDYKWGARFIHIGTKVDDNDPDAFKVQTVWTNGQPMFTPDFFVQMNRQKTGELEIPFANIVVSSDWNIDITKITGTFEGQIVRIKGDLNATKAVKENADLLLTSDFNLSTGGTLTLYVQADGKLKEISRTSEPEVKPDIEPISFNDTVIDSHDGSEFKYNGTTAQTLEDIEGGFEGQSITISFAGSGSGALTINSVEGVIKVDSTALLDTTDDFVKFVVIGGVFTEVERTIAA